jgi:hypothetical protein
MGSSSNHRSGQEQFRLWGTRDEPIKSAARALHGSGQQLRLWVNPSAREHQLVSAETAHGDVIGFISRPDARPMANRIERGRIARVTLIKASDARVRPVPVIEVQFTPAQSSQTETRYQPTAVKVATSADNQPRPTIRPAGSGRGCLVFVIAILPALLASGAIHLAQSLITRNHD